MWILLEKRKGISDLCQCECGTIKLVRRDRYNKTSFSCGHRKEKTKEQLDNFAWKTFKHTTKQRHIEYTINKTLFIDLRWKNCYICGKIGPNGIDRVDNRYGYILGNCAPCCKRCNIQKSDMLIEHICKLYNAVISFDGSYQFLLENK